MGEPATFSSLIAAVWATPLPLYTVLMVAAIIAIWLLWILVDWLAVVARNEWLNASGPGKAVAFVVFIALAGTAFIFNAIIAIILVIGALSLLTDFRNWWHKGQK